MNSTAYRPKSAKTHPAPLLQNQYVECLLKFTEKPQRALLDTGSHLNHMSDKLIRDTPYLRSLPKTKTDARATVADGRSVPYLYTIQVDFTIEGKLITQKFHVCKQLISPMILGQTFLRSHKVVISFPNDMIYFNHSPQILANNDYTLPSNHVSIITVKIPPYLPKNQLINLQPSILEVEVTLSDSKNLRQNDSGEAQHIRKNQILGVVDLVQENHLYNDPVQTILSQIATIPNTIQNNTITQQVTRGVTQITQITQQVTRGVTQITQITQQVTRGVTQITQQVTRGVTQITQITQQVTRRVTQITQITQQVSRGVTQITQITQQVTWGVTQQILALETSDSLKTKSVDISKFKELTAQFDFGNLDNNQNLDRDTADKLKYIILKNLKALYIPGSRIQKVNDFQLKLKLKPDHTDAWNKKFYPIHPTQKTQVDKQIEIMKKQGIITPIDQTPRDIFNSQYTSPCMIIKKPGSTTNEVRLVRT